MNRLFQAEDPMCAKAARTGAGGVRVATGRGGRAESREVAGARPQDFLQVGNTVGARLGVVSGDAVREQTGPHSRKPPLGLVQRPLSYPLLR